jgi:hypothetical protein
MMWYFLDLRVGVEGFDKYLLRITARSFAFYSNSLLDPPLAI